MKALAVKQPFASLIASGRKSIELRTWYTHYRGPLVIVASSQPKRKLMQDWQLRMGGRPLPLSTIVGVVDLVDIVESESRRDGRKACCDENVSLDRYCSWRFENPRRTEHVPFHDSRIMTFEIDDRLVRLLPR